MDSDDVVLEPEEGADKADAKVVKLKKEIESLKTEKQEYLDGWQRAKADYVNALKRFDEEKASVLEMGKTLSASAFLPALDSLIRAEEHGDIPESFKSIAKQLHEGMNTLGLMQIGEKGEAFDPKLHEALGQDPTSNKEEDDTVSQVLEVGWKGDKAVLRPAKVRVFSYQQD